MHFEPRRMVFRSSQGNDRIESILPPRRAALPTVRPRMVDEQNRDSLTPQFEQPVLHRHPGIAGTLASIRAERQKIIEDHEVDAAQDEINCASPLLRAD